MKGNSPIQETQKADGVQTIIYTKLTQLTWRNVFIGRKLLDYGYAFQSTDEQISDIREPSLFRLQHWVFSIVRNENVNVAPNVSSQFLLEAKINGFLGTFVIPMKRFTRYY